MRNPPAGYKHSDPAHLNFGRTADSSLLRKGFARGGAAYQSPPPGLSTEKFLDWRDAQMKKMGSAAPSDDLMMANSDAADWTTVKGYKVSDANPLGGYTKAEYGNS